MKVYESHLFLKTSKSKNLFFYLFQQRKKDGFKKRLLFKEKILKDLETNINLVE